MYKYAFIIVLALLTSCSSNDDSNDLSNNQDNFFALEVGNQWTYKYLERENFQSNNFIDNGGKTIHTIVDTEIINNETFYKMEIEVETSCNFCGQDEVIFIRQDGENLIDSQGQILFHKGDSNQDILAFQNSWGDLYLSPLGQDQISFENQVYQTTANKLYALNQNGQAFPGNDDIHYADGFGLVFRTISSVSNDEHRAEKYLIDFQNVLEN